MPPRVQITARDLTVLRTLGSSGPATTALLGTCFPSRAAAYVRLGTLARAGLLWRTTFAGERLYGLSHVGAEAGGVMRPRAQAFPSGRRGWQVLLISLLAEHGYRAAKPPRPSRTPALWFARPHTTQCLIAAHVSGTVLGAKQARRLADRLAIRRYEAVVVILAGASGTRPQELRDPRYPTLLVIPMPLDVPGRQLLQRYI